MNDNDSDRYDLGDVDGTDYELQPMGLREIAETFCRAADAMTTEEKACLRQDLGWELPQSIVWTPGDLEFLAEAGIKP